MATSSNLTVGSSRDVLLVAKGISGFDSTFLVFILITSSVTNGFLICKIITDRRLQTSINFLLMIHNVLNVLLCLSTLLPASLVLTGRLTSVSQDLCCVNASSYSLINFMSVSNLATIAVDRWRTISNSKYQLVAKQILLGQLLQLTIAVVFSLPLSYWFNKESTVIQFSQGFLKCRIHHKTLDENTASIISLLVMHCAIFILIPAAIIVFCFVKIFNKVKGRWNMVGPLIQAPDGIPVGCYLKSAYTNALLASGFLLLRYPELLFITANSVVTFNSKTEIYIQRLSAYITWIETSLFPFVCIMRNTTLLRQVTSMACCNFIMNTLSTRQDRRRRQYEVEQSTASDRCMITPTQDPQDVGMGSAASSSISTLRSGSPVWSKASSVKDAWTVAAPQPVTVF